MSGQGHGDVSAWCPLHCYARTPNHQYYPMVSQCGDENFTWSCLQCVRIYIPSIGQPSCPEIVIGRAAARCFSGRCYCFYDIILSVFQILTKRTKDIVADQDDRMWNYRPPRPRHRAESVSAWRRYSLGILWLKVTFRSVNRLPHWNGCSKCGAACALLPHQHTPTVRNVANRFGWLLFTVGLRVDS